MAGEGRMEGRGRAGQRGRKEILPGGGGWNWEGGYRLISVSWLSTTETHAHVTSHFW